MLRKIQSCPNTKNRAAKATRRAALIAVLVFLSCQREKTEIEPKPAPSEETTAPDRETADEVSPDAAYGFEKIGDIELARVEVEGFDNLPLKTKQLIYYHYLAALAGDAIFYSQLGPKNLAIKEIIEGILSVSTRLPEQIRKKIEPYFKLFFINHGNYDAQTGKKILPVFIPGELAAAAQVALDKGVDLGIDNIEGVKLDANRLERLEALLTAIRPHMFDRDFRPLRINNNQTEANDQIPDQVDKAGKDGLKPGLFADELKEVAAHLKSGLKLMKPSEQEAITHLIDFFESGEAINLTKYKKLWQKTDHEVETLIGFNNRHMDARGIKDSFGAIVAVRDIKMTKMIRQVAEHADYFNRQMPWNKEPKRSPSSVNPPMLNAFQVVIATGAGSPVSFADKRLYLTNTSEAENRMRSTGLVREFSINEEVANRREKWLRHVKAAHLVLLKVIGYNLNQTKRKYKGTLSKCFKNHADFIRELKAELVAVYLAFDPKNQEIGLIPSKECARTMYDDYASTMLEQLAQIGDAFVLIQTGMQVRQTIVQYAVEKGAVEIINNKGQVFTRVVDYQAMHAAIGELLGEVHGIQSESDCNRASKLSADYGSAVVDKWRQNVQSRHKALALPRAVVFVYPLLKPRLNHHGKIEDIDLYYPQSFLERRLILAEN